MKKLNVHLLAILLLFITGAVQAQEGGPIGIGLRATPDGGGLTSKIFFNENINLEIQANGSGGTYNDNGPSVTIGGLMEYNFILNNPSWRIYLGPGAHVGTWHRYGDAPGSGKTVFGFDVIGGVEYVLNTLPLGISLDVKPAMNFISGVTIFPNNTFGLSLRYYFGESWFKSTRHNIPGDN